MVTVMCVSTLRPHMFPHMVIGRNCISSAAIATLVIELLEYKLGLKPEVVKNTQHRL